MIRAILLDFGGTLDTNGIHWSEKFWDVYQRLGVAVTKPNFEKAFIVAEAQISKAVIDNACSFSNTLKTQVCLQISYLTEIGTLDGAGEIERLSDLIAQQCYGDVCHQILASKIVLKSLANNHILGLISNFYGNLSSVCNELGIADCFAAILDSTAIGVAKPDTLLFEIALQKLKVKSCECLMVGDSYDRDIVPAKLLGCSTVWLHGRSWKEPENVEMADHIISSLDQLPPLVEKITRSS